MKITELVTHLVHVPIPLQEQVRSGAGRKLARQAALVEVRTDEGVSGIGPCSFGSASVDLFAVRSIVEHAFAPALRGRDPARVEATWNELYYGLVTRTLGHRGMGVAILSAIDIALWDIKGKIAGRPVYELLGGPTIDAARCYGSSIYWSTPDQAAERALAFLRDGFGAVKLKIGVDAQQDLESLAAIREAVGSGVDIMVDANQCYSVDLAIKVGRRLDQYDVLFLEEPISIDDVAGHKHLADALDTRVATGENLYTRWGFLPFIVDRAVDIVQPDASRCGGISEAHRIADLAAAFHSYSAPHTFSDAYSVVANLHVMAATANTIILELDHTYNPLMTDLVQESIRPREGLVDLPTGPGLGLTLDRDFVEDHPYDGELGISVGAPPAVGLATELLNERALRELQVREP